MRNGGYPKMEIVILYGFICSGKSFAAKEYEKQGFKIISFDKDEKNFFANIKKSIESKENVVIDAPVWRVNKLGDLFNLNDLMDYLSYFLAKNLANPSSVLKVHVLDHLELDEVLSRVEKRWVLEPDHENHTHYNENLELCLKDIESRYTSEYQRIKFDY